LVGDASNGGNSYKVFNSTTGLSQIIVDTRVVTNFTLATPLVAISNAWGNDTTSVTTNEFVGEQGVTVRLQPYSDSIVTVQSFDESGAVSSTGLIRTGNYNGSWGASGELFNGSLDVGLVVESTATSNSGNQTMLVRFSSKIGAFKAVSFDYADLQDIANLTNNSGYTGQNAGSVNFYDLNNTLIQSVAIKANTAGNGLASQFSWTSTGASASYFTITTTYDLYGVDTLKFTAGAQTLASNGTTVDTTPTLSGTLSMALSGSQVVSIYEGATLLGNATLSGTSWSYTVPTTSVGSHTYTAKIMNGATVVHTSSNFVVNVAATPLVLDLNGDGVQTTSVSEGTQFDLLNMGKKVNVGWVDKHDGLLAMDVNGDGIINNGSELFGDRTELSDGTLAKNGWEALNAQDSNHDGKVDAQDANFDKLRVWVDANGNGSNDAGELRTMADEGIASIDLNHDNSSVQQNGNVVQMFSTFTTTDGVIHSMADVGFNVQNDTSNVYTLTDGDNLDLSGLANAAQLTMIDAVTDTEVNIVKLKLSDVLGVLAGQDDANAVHGLRLTGDTDDAVHLAEKEWTNMETTVAEGARTCPVHSAYDNSAVQLLIDQSMHYAGHMI
jgi:hypothetical protein